jgi:hypothetical protein
VDSKVDLFVEERQELLLQILRTQGKVRVEVRAHFSAFRQTPFGAISIDWFELGLLIERTAAL